ncbi:MAG: hypothetical protein IKN49_06955 [Elusimicrobiaceae bacterium]|nr:hypothetical protein [Elusimicrobiaceae bacterium]
MNKKQRLFFYVLCFLYLWNLTMEHYGYLEFVHHTAYWFSSVGFYAYAIFSYLELIYMVILTGYLGSTKGTFGRKFMIWFWQMLLSFMFITPLFRIFCPICTGPGELVPQEETIQSAISGIPWAVWCLWGLYHLYKYPVLPRAEKYFHWTVGILFVIIPLSVLSVLLLWDLITDPSSFAY